MSKVVDSVVATRADVTIICPFYSRASSVCGTRFRQPGEALVRLDGPRAIADSSAFRLGRFGAVELIRDALNGTTTIERALGGCNASFPAFVTKVIAVNGLTTTACPDARGNLARQDVLNPRGDSVNDSTKYQWDQRWDKATAIVNTLGDSTFIAEYDGYANFHTIRDQRSASPTAFYYYGSGAVRQLPYIITDSASRGVALDKTQFEYDTLGNTIGVYQLTDSASSISNRYNAIIHYTQDAIGRTIKSCVSIDDLAGAQPANCTVVMFDKMGRDSVVKDSAPSYNGVPAQVATVKKYHGNEGQLLSLSREKSGGGSALLTDYTYDRAERVTSESGPTPGTKYMWYDAAGNLDSTTNRVATPSP